MPFTGVIVNIISSSWIQDNWLLHRDYGVTNCISVTFIYTAQNDSNFRIFNIQIWLINNKKGVFHRTLQLSFPQTSINAFFHMWSLQERGGSHLL